MINVSALFRRCLLSLKGCHDLLFLNSLKVSCRKSFDSLFGYKLHLNCLYCQIKLYSFSFHAIQNCYVSSFFYKLHGIFIARIFCLFIKYFYYPESNILPPTSGRLLLFTCVFSYLLCTYHPNQQAFGLLHAVSSAES